MKTAECEGIAEIGALLTGASAARIVSVEPIPGGHNSKAVVETARYGVKTVVCGAPNCRAGMSTVYVPLGKKTIQGVESDGMLAAGAELGQPTHAFDRDLLSGDTIFVRPARAGEQILALNDETYSLNASNLVIADARGPVAIAGVIGGKDTAIGPATRSIVLESANFH